MRSTGKETEEYAMKTTTTTKLGTLIELMYLGSFLLAIGMIVVG